MKTLFIKSLDEIFNYDDLALMLGNFDGFHKGHQKLLEELLNIKSKKGLLTFYPHPLKILKNFDFKYLDTIKDKEKILSNNIDYLIVLMTSKEILDSSKDCFISFLKNNHVSDIVCGSDFTFAKNKCGTVSDLLCFNLHIVPDFKINDLRVSSTIIRDSLKNGYVEDANKYLGKYYEIEGIVSAGSKLGRTIGFPTANICENEYLLPKEGVYFGYAIINEKKYYGMINIGHNPTFNFVSDRRLEINIFDFDKDIYNSSIRVGFIKKIRDEKKFNSKDELIKMLIDNRNECKKLAKLENSN